MTVFDHKFIKTCAITFLVIAAFIGMNQTAYSQEKSEYEKIQEDKVKRYRKRIKRSKSKSASSTRRQLLFLRFNKKRRQGDRAYSGNIQPTFKNFSSTNRRPSQRAGSRKRIRRPSASGRYIVNKRAKPYQLKETKKWEKAYTGDNYGRKKGIKPKNTQRISSFISPKPYSNRGKLGDKPYSGQITGGFNSATKRGERAWKGDIAGNPIRNRSRRKGNFNIFPKADPYAGRKMRSERQRISRDQVSFGTSPRNTQRSYKGKGSRINIRSASGRYTVNKRMKPYALKETKKWEDTYTGDNYGRKAGISPRNTQRISSFVSPNPYQDRGRMGDKPYVGITGGGFTSPPKGERAWKGDIAGRKLDYTKPRNTQRIGGQAPGSKPPSRATRLGQIYTGTIPLGKTIEKFGSAHVNFQGNIKAKKPLKGGGSRPRNNWNNKGNALPTISPSGEARAGQVHTGNINVEEVKFKYNSSHLQYSGDINVMDLKEGFESAHLQYSGDINVMDLKEGFESDHLQYSGDIKAFNVKRKFGSAHVNFQGNLKAKKPLKGGGSQPRGAWNNKESSLPKKYSASTREPGVFSGNLKAQKRENRSSKAGMFSGNMRASRSNQNQTASATRTGSWNNEETSTTKKSVTPVAYYSTRHTGRIKRKTDYKRNDAANENALRVREPNKAYFQAGNFQGNMKRNRRKVDGVEHKSTKFFDGGNDSNSVKEKNKFFSFKLLWNKLFSSDKPSREKVNEPRYDKNEKGIWNE